MRKNFTLSQESSVIYSSLILRRAAVLHKTVKIWILEILPITITTQDLPRNVPGSISNTLQISSDTESFCIKLNGKLETFKKHPVWLRMLTRYAISGNSTSLSSSAGTLWCILTWGLSMIFSHDAKWSRSLHSLLF